MKAYDPIEQRELEQLLREIRSRGSEGISLPELSQLITGAAEERDAFADAMKLLAAGKPVGFGCFECAWVSFGADEACIVFHASKPEELLETKQMILEHMEYLNGLLAGLEKACKSLSDPRTLNRAGSRLRQGSHASTHISERS